MDFKRGIEAFERLTRPEGYSSQKKGACKKCGNVGHLSFECKNLIKLDPIEPLKTTSKTEVVKKAKRSSKHKRTLPEISSSSSDTSSESSSDSESDNSSQDENEKRKRKKAKRKREKEKEREKAKKQKLSSKDKKKKKKSRK